MLLERPASLVRPRVLLTVVLAASLIAGTGVTMVLASGESSSVTGTAATGATATDRAPGAGAEPAGRSDEAGPPEDPGPPEHARGPKRPIPDDTVKAGVASVDASWHVGASGGQFSEHQSPPGSRGLPGEETLGGELPDEQPEQEYVDPFLHAKRKRPTRGIQSRVVTRALVIEGVNDERVAIVGNDLYLPNDLVNRRVAQLLEQHDLAVTAGLPSPLTGQTHKDVTGIQDGNLAVTVSHNHNSAFYSTPSWGTWIFQDVFDLRFYEYMATRMATAVINASDDVRPVRIGAATVPFNEIQAHTIGPEIADDGTPASQPYSHTTGMMTLVRLDDISDPKQPEPYAAWVTLGLHPEWTWGYELFSGDITHAAMRVIDRELGVTTVMSQRETGSSGPHKSLRVHEPEDRREFQQSGWQQLDVGARLWADRVHEAWRAIEDEVEPAPFDPQFPRTDGPPVELVPFGHDLDVSSVSMRFAPPWTRPVPGISNCNTASLFHGDWRVPVLGLPDCNDDVSGGRDDFVDAFNDGAEDAGLPEPARLPERWDQGRPLYDELKQAGVPVPESYTATKLTAVEETAAVHLMAMRIGDIGVTFCPCEQFTDTAQNIRTRLDRVDDNVWHGWDWTKLTRPDGTPFCTQNEDTTWTCADPTSLPRLPEDAPAWPDINTARHSTITDLEYRRMLAQIHNDAEGWEDLENAPTHLGGEAEPNDPDEIKGNYTHREIDGYGAPDGYGLTIAVGMANDYFGYTPSYRDMRAFDHYRKALNGLGLHGSDYLATRLVRLAASLRGAPEVQPSALDLAYQAESGRARAVSQGIGELARAHIASYDATLPPDGGEPAITDQPDDITRFDGAVVRFVGGSSYTDLPHVTVQRRVSRDGAPPGNDKGKGKGKGRGPEATGWVTFADQMGEIQTEVDFPTPDELGEFATGEFAWEWTASWEAFVSQVPLPDAQGEVRTATPAGTYRFVIEGQRRTNVGDVVEPYRLVSDPFTVHPWDGLTVDRLDVAADTVRIGVGPTTTERFELTNDDGVVVYENTFTFGSIDYPNAWAWETAMTTVADKRTETEKGDHGEDGERVYYRYRPGTSDDQAYCLFCRFHPWVEAGEASVGWVTIERADGTRERVTAARVGNELVAQAELEPGDRVWVAPGDVRDEWGNTNDAPSAVVTVS